MSNNNTTININLIQDKISELSDLFKTIIKIIISNNLFNYYPQIISDLNVNKRQLLEKKTKFENDKDNINVQDYLTYLNDQIKYYTNIYTTQIIIHDKTNVDYTNNDFKNNVKKNILNIIDNLISVLNNNDNNTNYIQIYYNTNLENQKDIIAFISDLNKYKSYIINKNINEEDVLKLTTLINTFINDYYIFQDKFLLIIYNIFLDIYKVTTTIKYQDILYKYKIYITQQYYIKIEYINEINIFNDKLLQEILDILSDQNILYNNIKLISLILQFCNKYKTNNLNIKIINILKQIYCNLYINYKDIFHYNDTVLDLDNKLSELNNNINSFNTNFTEIYNLSNNNNDNNYMNDEYKKFEKEHFINDKEQIQNLKNNLDNYIKKTLLKLNNTTLSNIFMFIEQYIKSNLNKKYQLVSQNSINMLINNYKQIINNLFNLNLNNKNNFISSLLPTLQSNTNNFCNILNLNNEIVNNYVEGEFKQEIQHTLKIKDKLIDYIYLKIVNTHDKNLNFLNQIINLISKKINNFTIELKQLDLVLFDKEKKMFTFNNNLLQNKITELYNTINIFVKNSKLANNKEIQQDLTNQLNIYIDLLSQIFNFKQNEYKKQVDEENKKMNEKNKKAKIKISNESEQNNILPKLNLFDFDNNKQQLFDIVKKFISITSETNIFNDLSNKIFKHIKTNLIQIFLDNYITNEHLEQIQNIDIQLIHKLDLPKLKLLIQNYYTFLFDNIFKDYLSQFIISINQLLFNKIKESTNLLEKYKAVCVTGVPGSQKTIASLYSLTILNSLKTNPLFTLYIGNVTNKYFLNLIKHMFSEIFQISIKYEKKEIFNVFVFEIILVNQQQNISTKVFLINAENAIKILKEKIIHEPEVVIIIAFDEIGKITTSSIDLFAYEFAKSNSNHIPIYIGATIPPEILDNSYNYKIQLFPNVNKVTSNVKIQKIILNDLTKLFSDNTKINTIHTNKCLIIVPDYKYYKYIIKYFEDICGIKAVMLKDVDSLPNDKFVIVISTLTDILGVTIENLIYIILFNIFLNEEQKTYFSDKMNVCYNYNTNDLFQLFGRFNRIEKENVITKYLYWIDVDIKNNIFDINKYIKTNFLLGVYLISLVSHTYNHYIMSDYIYNPNKQIFLDILEKYFLDFKKLSNLYSKDSEEGKLSNYFKELIQDQYLITFENLYDINKDNYENFTVFIRSFVDNYYIESISNEMLKDLFTFYKNKSLTQIIEELNEYINNNNILKTKYNYNLSNDSIIKSIITSIQTKQLHIIKDELISDFKVLPTINSYIRSCNNYKNLTVDKKIKYIFESLLNSLIKKNNKEFALLLIYFYSQNLSYINHDVHLYSFLIDLNYLLTKSNNILSIDDNQNIFLNDIQNILDNKISNFDLKYLPKIQLFFDKLIEYKTNNNINRKLNYNGKNLFSLFAINNRNVLSIEI